MQRRQRPGRTPLPRRIHRHTPYPPFFFFTLVTGPRRSLSFKLSVYEPQIRAVGCTRMQRRHPPARTPLCRRGCGCGTREREREREREKEALEGVGCGARERERHRVRGVWGCGGAREREREAPRHSEDSALAARLALDEFTGILRRVRI